MAKRNSTRRSAARRTRAPAKASPPAPAKRSLRERIQQTWRVWFTRDIDQLRASVQKLTGLRTTLKPTGDAGGAARHRREQRVGTKAYTQLDGG